MPYYNFSDFNVTKESFHTKDNLKVTLFHKPKAPISASIIFRSGSRYDPQGLMGLSHFVEHMILAGTEEFPTKDKLAMYIENLGGGIGASTSMNSLTMDLFVPEVEDFSCVVKILNEILNKSKFDPKTIETERGAILRELGSNESSPAKHVYSLNRQLMFQGTSCGGTTIGIAESINNTKREDLINFYNNFLTASRAVLLVSGGITSQELKEVLDNGLNLRSGEPTNLNEDIAIIRNISKNSKIYKTNSMLEVNLGFRTCKITEDDFWPFIFLARILGGGRASRLTKLLRYEKGLVYGVQAHNEFYIDIGDFKINTSVDKKNLDEVLKIIADELNKIIEFGVNEEELSFYKNRLHRSTKFQMETSDSWIDRHSISEFIEDSPFDLPKYIERTAQVTTKQIQDVGKKYIGNDKWYLSLCGDIDIEGVNIDF